MMSGATTAGRASLPKRCGAAAALAYKICSGSLLLLLLLQALDGTGATAAATATTTSACDANPNAANRLSDACDIFQNAKSKILLEPEEDCWVPCKRTSGPCPACGENGLCCRIGFLGSGCNGNMGGQTYHTCVKPWTAHEIVRVRDRSDLVGDWRLIGEYGEVKRAPSKKSRTIEVAFPQFGDKIIRVAKQALSATSKKTKNAINAPGTTGASGANKENKQIFPTRIHIEAKDVRYFKTANPMGSEAARKRGKSAGLPNPKSKTKATRKHVGGKAKAAAKAVVRPSTNVAAGGGAAVVAETRPSKPSTATVTYVAEAWSSEVVTFHGISFGQADLFKPPTDPRDDQLGYAEKIFAPGTTAAASRTLRRAVSTSDSVDDVDVEKVKLKELDAVDAGDGADSTTTGSTGIMSTTSEASLSSKNRRTHKQPEGGVFNTGVEAPTPKVGGAPATVLHTSVAGPPAPAEPRKKVEKFRFFAMDRRSACQDGTIHMRQEQASSRNCLRLDITLPTKHAIAYSSAVKEQQFEEMFQDSAPKPKSKGKANANANYAAASGGTRGQKRPREHDVSAAASTGVEKQIQKAESGSALGAGKMGDDVLEQDGTAAHHALADEDHNPPNKPKPALLPVFVYFTGSCFAAGAQTDGTQLIKNMMAVDPRGAIFVSLQFRAGTLGHAGSEGLKAIQQTQKHEPPAFANWSLLDSRLALRWIQRHIGAFGGDKTRVTLFGQSSGACMASAHFLSPKSFDLFSSLITSSGGFNGWCTAPLDSVGEDQFEQLYLKAVQHKRQKPKCFEPDVLRGSSPALAAPPAAKKSAAAAASTNKAKAKPLTAKAKAKAKAAGAASKARGGLSFLQGTRFQHAKAKARPRAPTTSKEQERNKRICMARFLTQSKLSEYDLASFSVPSPCFSGCDSSLLVDQQELRGTMPEILTFGIPGVHFAEHKPVLHGYTGDDGVEYMGEIGKKKENISDNPKWIRDENGFLTYLDWAFGDATSARAGEKDSAPNLNMEFYKKLAIAYEPKDVREPRVIDVERERAGATTVGVDLDGVVIDLELEQPPYPLPQVDPMMRPGVLQIEASATLQNAAVGEATTPPEDERPPSQEQQPPPSPIQRMVRGIFTPLFSNTTTCPNCYVHPRGDEHISSHLHEQQLEEHPQVDDQHGGYPYPPVPGGRAKGNAEAFNYLYKPKSGAKALLPAIYEPPTALAAALPPAPVLNVKVNHPEETQTGFVDQQQLMNSIVLGLSTTNAEILGASERLSRTSSTSTASSGNNATSSITSASAPAVASSGAAQNTWNTFAPWFFAAERALTGWEYTCPTEYASDLLAKKSVKVFEYAYMDSNNYIKDDANTPLVPHGWESGPLFDEIEEDLTKPITEGDGDGTPAGVEAVQKRPARGEGSGLERAHSSSGTVVASSSHRRAGGDVSEESAPGAELAHTKVVIEQAELEASKSHQEFLILSHRMLRYWINFARNGDPNVESDPREEEVKHVDGGPQHLQQMKQQPEPPQVSPHLPTDFGFLMERCKVQRDLQQEHAKLKTLANELSLYNAAAIAKIRERIGIIERFLPEGESSGGASSDFSCGLTEFGTSSMTGGLATSSASGAGAFGGFGSSGLFGGGTSASAAPSPLLSSATARAQPRPLSVMVTPRAAAPATFGQEYDKSRGGFSDMSTTIGGFSTRSGFSAAPESSSSSFSSSWAGSRAMLASRSSAAPRLITVDESSHQHRAASETGEEPQRNIFKAPSLPHWPQFTSDRRVAFSLARGQFFGLNNRLDTSEQCGLWKSEWSQAFTCIPHEVEKPWPTRTSS